MYLESNYKISIYDFDRAYNKKLLDNKLLTKLCDTGNGCNSLSFKDIYVFIQSLIYQFITKSKDPQFSLLTKYLYELLKVIIPSEYFDLLIKNMDDIINQNSNLHWSSYCVHLDNNGYVKLNYPCDDTKKEDQVMDWLSSVYERFDNFSNDIKIIKSYSYYQKYLKYKKKYLMLKNK